MTTRTIPDPILTRMVELAMAKCDIAVAGHRAMLADAREARRDLLIERGLARAVRARHYDCIQRGVK